MPPVETSSTLNSVWRAAGEIDDAGFVGDGNECAADGDEVGGGELCWLGHAFLSKREYTDVKKRILTTKARRHEDAKEEFREEFGGIVLWGEL